MRRILRFSEKPPIVEKNTASKDTVIPPIEERNNKDEALKNHLLSPFIVHISRYTGQTVTIFTSGGGASGSGLTGILLSVSRDYITLVTIPGPPPCSRLVNAGSITHISAEKIASFSHDMF